MMLKQKYCFNSLKLCKANYYSRFFEENKKKLNKVWQRITAEIS